MSVSLAKIITSGALGLNTTGLALYFGPQMFREKITSPIYEQTETDNLIVKNKNFSRFIEKEETLLKNLKEKLSQVSESLKKLSKDKSTEHTNIINHFSKVEEAEKELQQLYEENQKILAEISKLAKQEYDNSKNKLEAEERIKQLEFYIKSLQSVSAAMYSWGVSIKDFICLIENKEANNCKDKSKQWFRSNVSSQQEGSNGGGRRFGPRKRFPASVATVARVQAKARSRIAKS